MPDSALKVALISGSLRKGSYNTMLVRFVGRSLEDLVE